MVTPTWNRKERFEMSLMQMLTWDFWDKVDFSR
jgi:hypothetical protein